MSQIGHVPDLDPFYQLLLAKAPGRRTGRSGLDLDALGDQLAQHVGGVVITGRRLLIALGDTDPICEQKEIHGYLLCQQSCGVTEGVVRFLASIRRILDN